MAFLPLYDRLPTRFRPWCTYTLLAANGLIFASVWPLVAGGAGWVIPGYGLVPSRLRLDPLGEAFTLVSSQFLHADFAHLGFNMLSLHIFGDNLEECLGRVRYLAFYALCGVVAGLAQFAVDVSSPLPIVGASGAIGGVMGGYLMLFPRAPVVTLNLFPLLWLAIGFLPTLPAWAVGAWFLLVNLYEAVTTFGAPATSGVAVFAHLGGFATGLVLIQIFRMGRHVRPRRWTGFREGQARAGAQGTSRWRRRR